MRLHKITTYSAFFLTLSLLASSVTAPAEEPAKRRFVIGFGLKSLYEVDVKDANVAFSLWSKELGESKGMFVESFVYVNIDDLVKDFDRGKVDLIIVKSNDFLNKFEKAYRHGDIILTYSVMGKKTRKYLLLARRDNVLPGLKSLKAGRLAITKNDELSMIYLNTLLHRQNLPAANRFFSLIDEKLKPSQAIMSVFFKQNDACLVPDSSFSIASELNPQLGVQLEAVASSDELIQGLAIFRKDYDQENKEIVLERILSLNKYARGKQILLLFKANNFEPMAEGELATVRSLMQEYSRRKAWE